MLSSSFRQVRANRNNTIKRSFIGFHFSPDLLINSGAVELIKAFTAVKVLGTGLYYVYKENSHWLLGLDDGRKANKNKSLTKSIVASIPNLGITMQDENSFYNRLAGMHVLGHSLAGTNSIKSYFDIRKQLFNVESERKNLVVTVSTNTACLVFYSNKAKRFEPLMLKNLIVATFSISPSDLNSLENASTSVAESRSLLDNMSSKKKLAFINTETGVITLARPRFIVMEHNGRKSISFIVQTENGATLFGVPAVPPGMLAEDYVPHFHDKFRFGCFKVLVAKGYPLKYTIGEMFLTLPRRDSYEVLATGRMYLRDFAKLLLKLSDIGHINFFIQDPNVDIYPLTVNGKICMKGTFVKPGPAGYFVQVKRVQELPEELYQVTISFLDSSRHCELHENGFLGENNRILLC